MTEITSITNWMFESLHRDKCLYQDDVVDFIIREGSEGLLRENSDGNLVLSTNLLSGFKKVTLDSVVWIRPDKYWRYRVTEDEPGRNARG